MRPIFVFSFALNLLFAASLVLARVDASRGSTSSQPGAAVSAYPLPDMSAHRPASIADAASLTEYYRQLRAAGLDHGDTLLPAAGWVYRALAAAGPLHDEYWSSARYDRERQAALLTLSEALRVELSDLYGAAAAESPEFLALFRPLGPRFAFLSSAQQLSVAARLGAGAVAAGPGFPSVCPASGPAAHASPVEAGRAEGIRPLRGRVDEEVAALLGPELRFEFALRTSPLGAPLREIGLDEASFRDAFALLEAFAAAPDAGRQIAATDALAERIGPLSAHRVLRRFDPTWPGVAAMLEEAGVAPDAADAAYSEIRQWRTESLRLLLAGLPQSELATTVADARQRAEQRLRSLVGASLAERLLAVGPVVAAERSPGAC